MNNNNNNNICLCIGAFCVKYLDCPPFFCLSWEVQDSSGVLVSGSHQDEQHQRSLQNSQDGIIMMRRCIQGRGGTRRLGL